jgi:hypothetical protein
MFSAFTHEALHALEKINQSTKASANTYTLNPAKDIHDKHHLLRMLHPSCKSHPTKHILLLLYCILLDKHGAPASGSLNHQSQ